MEEVTTKTCKQYNIEKPITDFYPDKRSRDGHKVICKQCVKENLNSKKKKQTELTKVRGFYISLEKLNKFKNSTIIIMYISTSIKDTIKYTMKM